MRGLPSLLPALLLALSLGAASVRAEEPRREMGMPGERTETWDAVCSRLQAERDTTLVPVGKGAIFVPAMTDASKEPKWVVEEDGKELLTVDTGRKAIVDPGIYTVHLGSGALADRFARKVLVKENRTTIVPATWSGLVVNVVDERSIPFRGSYELVRLPDRANIGLGLGADVELGEELRTWLLSPGTYMVIKTGESYQARRDFYTFRLLPGELLKLTVVMNPEDGSILGAGQVALADEDTEVKDWTLQLVLGADAEFSQRSHVVGVESGYGFTLGGYVDFVAQYKPQKHLLYTRLKFEEKQIKLPGEPFQKDLDELRFDVLYVYRVLPWLGPYVRAGTQSPVFPGYHYFDTERAVVRVDASGERHSLGLQKGQYKISNPFAPLEIKGGLGIGFILTASYIFDANFRVGFGGRALFNQGLLSPADDSRTAYEFEMMRRDDAYQYGVEATLVGSLRITRWVVATTEFEFLEPVDDYKHPIVDWETTIGLRLISFASVNYIFKLLHDFERSSELQTEHRVLLRFTWRIL